MTSKTFFCKKDRFITGTYGCTAFTIRIMVTDSQGTTVSIIKFQCTGKVSPPSIRFFSPGFRTVLFTFSMLFHAFSGDVPGDESSLRNYIISLTVELHPVIKLKIQ